jgi:hypothetical protein
MLVIRNVESRIMAFLRSALQKTQDGLRDWDDNDDTALDEKYAAQ